MKKKRQSRNGICPICDQVSDLTKGHVLPLVWFCDPKPDDLWIIDECFSCNQSHAEGDIQIRDFIVGQVDPRFCPEAASLWKKSIRAYRNRRSKVIYAMSQTSEEIDVLNEYGLWVGATYRGVVEAKLIDNALEHLAKRLTAHDRNCVVRNIHVDAKLMPAQGVQSLLGKMASLGASPLAGFQRGKRIAPEVKLTRMLDRDNKYSGTWLISFYNMRMGIRIITQPQS